QRWEELGELDGESGFDAAAWEEALAPYFEEYDEIGTGPDARGPALLLIDEQPGVWRVAQILDDPAGDHDWGISDEVDLAASDAADEPVLTITAVNQLCPVARWRSRRPWPGAPTRAAPPHRGRGCRSRRCP